MPRISEFLGIVVTMYYNDHSPPHFHATYAGYEATIEIRTLSVISGRLPRRALALVREWAALHSSELASSWQAARRGEPLQPIPGFEWPHQEA